MMVQSAFSKSTHSARCCGAGRILMKLCAECSYLGFVGVDDLGSRAQWVLQYFRLIDFKVIPTTETQN